MEIKKIKLSYEFSKSDDYSGYCGLNCPNLKKSKKYCKIFDQDLISPFKKVFWRANLCKMFEKIYLK